MKPIFPFLLLLATLFCPRLPAQYLAFPDSGAVWKVDEYNSDILIYCYGTITTVYGIQDTIIRNGEVFQKINVFSSGVCSPNACFDLGQMEAVRTDTATGIVYAWNYGQEMPLFDYSLNAGDTMWTYDGSFWWGATTVVDSVDTVVLGGLARKRLYVSNYLSFQPEFIIEGIGPSYGLFVPPGMGVNGERGTLACYSESGIPIYSNPNSCSSGGPCNAVSVDDPLGESGPTVSPNPSSGRVRIGLEGAVIDGVRLMDAVGRVLWEGNGLQAQGEYEVDLAAYPKGGYLVEVMGETGDTFTVRVVRE